MASLSRNLYYIPGLAPHGRFILRAMRLSIKLRQGTLEIVIKEVLLSIRATYQTILSSPLTNVTRHSVIWPYAMTTLLRSDSYQSVTFLLNWTFYRIMRNFHRIFATVWHAFKGCLPLRTTSYFPFWGFADAQIVETSFTESTPMLPLYLTRHSSNCERFPCSIVLTPAYTWSNPIFGLAYVLFGETNPFTELVVIFANCAIRTSFRIFADFAS